jgi:hypothetical protein
MLFTTMEIMETPPPPQQPQMNVVVPTEPEANGTDTLRASNSSSVRTQSIACSRCLLKRQQRSPMEMEMEEAEQEQRLQQQDVTAVSSSGAGDGEDSGVSGSGDQGL